MELEAIIGLEVHMELSTETKLFCNCSTKFGAEPNTQCCPVCMGMPGALPVLNKKAIDYAIKTGVTLNCHIAKFSNFDRKNYYYPDLPKAYQNTQYYHPICKNGYVNIESNDTTKRIRVNRMHIEEDAGKLIHDSQKQETRIDYNRAGIPLIEIVTEPDFRYSTDTLAFLEQLKLTAIYLGVSDCKMQEGSLRCDVNISVRPKKTNDLGPRVEIKNLNSFRAIRDAIEYEFNRHKYLLEKDEIIKSETRRWNDNNRRTESMQNRDRNADYRYISDADLPSIFIEDIYINQIRRAIPELPLKKYKRFIKEYGLAKRDADILVSDNDLANFFEACIVEYNKPIEVCNWLTGDLLKLINERKDEIKTIKIKPKMIKDLLQMIDSKIISNTMASRVFEIMFETGDAPQSIVNKYNLVQVSDDSILESIVDSVVKKNNDSINDYKAGKKKVLSYLMGQAMKATNGKANPVKLKQLIIKRLEQA